MTRSEERLRVGIQQHETGRARLREYVVTEDVTTTVPVSHEEARVVREPIQDSGRTGDRPRIEDAGTEVPLHAEQAVGRKEAVPVERVRLETEKVTEQQEISDKVRKERVEYDTDKNWTTAAASTARATDRRGTDIMRNTAAAIGLTAALLLAPAAPAVAHAGTGQVSVVAAPTPTPDESKKEESSGGWGLWGLAGLLGLAGLIPRKKKERDVPRTQGGPTTGSHPTDPTTGSHPTDPRA